MWLAQSFLIWTYAITTILTCAVVGLGLHIVTFLFAFVLHLGVLHKMTAPYSSRHSALSALRCRMLLCATVGTLIFGVAIATFSSLLFTGLTGLSWTQSTGLTADGEPQTFLDFMTAQAQARAERLMAGGVSTLEDYLSITAACALLSLFPVVAAWFLSRGYLTMLISERGSQPVIDTARVHDVVAFALVGMVGLAIGQASFTGLSSGVLMLMGTLPKLDEADGKSMSPLASVAANVARPIMELAGQLIIATAVAERRVLGLPTTMGHVLLLFWAANFVGALPGALLQPSSTEASGIFSRGSRLCLLLDLLVQVAVMFVFGKTCWRRYRVAVGVEASKERRIQNARILSSQL